MKRVLLPSVALAVVFGLAPVPAQAQLELCTIRGKVVDEQGAPVADAKLDLEFKGESRQKILRSVNTDKKGQFLRAGLKVGPWQIVVSKPGFKTYRMETSLSGGGISEIPPITMGAAAPVDPAAAGAAPVLPPSATTAETSAQQAEKVKALGEKYNKAVAAVQAGQLAEAETLFKEVTVDFPDLGAAYHNLGYIYDKKGDLPGAEAAYRKAIELQSGSVDSYISLATLLVRNRRDDDALKVMKDGAGILGQDAKFQFATGTIAMDAGKSAEAEAAFSKAAELDPNNVETQFFLGSLAVGRADVAAATKYLEKYVAAAPATAKNVETAKALLATLGKKK